MRDIVYLKEQLERQFAKKFCNVDNISKCPKENCECRVAAEVKAYMMSIIPKPYYDYSIWDFTGIGNGQKLLDNKTIIDAKEKLIFYCWEGISLDDIAKMSGDKRKLDSLSSIDKRRRTGANVVIYSPAAMGSKSQPTGKTMIASIIMREAIKRRAFAGHMSDTYAWSQFSTIQELIKKDDPEAMDIRTCDWLVVDDIGNDIVSAKGMSYIKSLIDPAFIDRHDNELPTILVFDFDIDIPGIDWKGKFGAGIYRILSDEKTTKIRLV